MTTEEALRRVSRAVSRLARSDTPVKRRNARRGFAKATRLLHRKADKEYPRIAPPRPEAQPGPKVKLTRSQRKSLRVVRHNRMLAKLGREGWEPVPMERRWQVMSDCLAAKVGVRFVRAPGEKQAWPWVRKWVLAVPQGDVDLMRECRGSATKQRAVLAVELLKQDGKEVT